MMKCGWLVMMIAILVAGCSGGTQPLAPAAPATPVAPAVVPATAGDTVAASAAPAADLRTYRCTVCGYEYVPAANGNVSFTALPAEWKCPRCGKSKDKFNPVG